MNTGEGVEHRMRWEVRRVREVVDGKVRLDARWAVGEGLLRPLDSALWGMRGLQRLKDRGGSFGDMRLLLNTLAGENVIGYLSQLGMQHMAWQAAKAMRNLRFTFRP